MFHMFLLSAVQPLFAMVCVRCPQFHRVSMSNPKVGRINDTSDNVVELLRDLYKSGRLNELLAQIHQEEQPSLSMTDAPKRRLSQTGPVSSDDFEPDEFQVIPPTSPKMSTGYPTMIAMNDSETPPSVSLPEGVKSFEQWGRTVCELPKVQALDLSYEELYHMAASGDKEKSEYLVWVRRYNGSSSRTLDLKQYVLIKDRLTTGPKTYFPGSKDIRRLK